MEIQYDREGAQGDKGGESPEGISLEIDESTGNFTIKVEIDSGVNESLMELVIFAKDVKTTQ